MLESLALHRVAGLSSILVLLVFFFNHIWVNTACLVHEGKKKKEEKEGKFLSSREAAVTSWQQHY